MKLSNEVLAVVSTLDVEFRESEQHTLVRIEGQLERKRYLEVAVVLEALGGKWNKKAKATIFPGDATDVLEAVMLHGEVETIREKRKRDGFFATPNWLAQQLCTTAQVRAGRWVYEPSAGEGAIAFVAAEMGAYVAAFERDAERAAKMEAEAKKRKLKHLHVKRGDCFAFMRRYPIDCYDDCVMNPPFIRELNPMLGMVGMEKVVDHLDHVRHAFDQIKPDGSLVSVLPSGVSFRQDKRHVAFRTWVKTLGGVISALPDDAFKESGTSVNTVVLHIRKPLSAGLF